MKHDPCTACGYVIQHDEECPGCAREEMDAQLVTLKRRHEQLRAAAEMAGELLCSRDEVLVSRIEIAQILSAALDATPAELSERAVEMMRQAKTLATAEVERHFAAGRQVYGRRDGKLVVLEPPPTESVPETYVIQQLEAKTERLKTELVYAATELERAGVGLADAGLASHIRDALKAEANR